MSMTGQTHLVTGASSGLGRASAIALARLGARVVLLVRDRSRGDEVRGTILRQGGSADVLQADLSSRASVRRAAAEVLGAHRRLDVLIHNAAIYTPRRTLTGEGLETMLATNHLGPFLLTALLRGALLAAKPSRVIVVTAPSTTRIDFDDIQGERRFGSLSRFGATKMANLMFTYELASRLAGSGVTANAVFPGVFKSGLMDAAPPLIRWLGGLRAASAEAAAEHIVQAATDPALADVSGVFFSGRRPARTAPDSLAVDLRERLWDLSEGLTGASIPHWAGD
ncbi:MAG: SDR family NAD(P)-dependent oxidoreductase [Chloroflexi bacterium]|nr:MAG: SDR family NAD(P)-dependent oxidoreductase [Chloroflexota bacterium]TME16287.1 MAG: SDR family NAD(P)-dependent oxidoreductase [Chloroflexota bacterium]TME19027.1 MAG: SDR family NAD(P)-dependent oxidoreductase [Chloroflexota bacterium]